MEAGPVEDPGHDIAQDVGQDGVGAEDLPEAAMPQRFPLIDEPGEESQQQGADSAGDQDESRRPYLFVQRAAVLQQQAAQQQGAPQDQQPQ